MSKKHIIALVGVGLMLVGNFLPFAEKLWFSMSLWDGDDGKILLVIVVLSVVWILLRWNIFTIVMALAGGGVATLDMVDAADKGMDLKIGGYVIIVGAVVTAVGAILAMGDKRKNSEAQTT